MSELPGNRIPPANLPPGGTSTPAVHADMPTVYCRHSVSWSWVPDKGGYLCDDPQHHQSDEAFVNVGAIPIEHQPPYTFPPNTNKAIQAVLDAEDEQQREDARRAYAERLIRGY